MTLNVYASLFEDDQDAVSERLDAALPKADAAGVRPEGSDKITQPSLFSSRTGL